MAAWDRLDAYLEEMIDRHRLTLTDDLISDLICAEDDGDHLTHDELLMLAATLLSAGTDPTPPTANSPQPSSLYSGPRPTNPKPHSDWTTKRVPLTSTTLAWHCELTKGA